MSVAYALKARQLLLNRKKNPTRFSIFVTLGLDALLNAFEGQFKKK
jgi:hypothetical protein